MRNMMFVLMIVLYIGGKMVNGKNVNHGAKLDGKHPRMTLRVKREKSLEGHYVTFL